MVHLTDYLKPAEFKTLKSLELMAKQLVEGMITGQHRSPHKGFSTEFAQHREYVPGDEIRRLDWKVFAKTDRYCIREYEEETNLRAMVLLDASGSMSYGGTGRLTKHEYGIRLAASLSYLLSTQRDSVGLVTFDDEVRAFIPPLSSTRHLRTMLQAMVDSTPGGESDLAGVFLTLVPRIRRRGLLIVISDCFGDVAHITTALSHFRSANHEVLVFHVMDPDEIEFPFRDWTRFESLEKTTHFQLLDPLSFRKAYLQSYETYRQELVQGCRRNKIDLIPIRTDQPFNEALAAYLSRRHRAR